ncbi:hypothetical protein WDU94_004449 [Cyamophila willieti]
MLTHLTHLVLLVNFLTFGVFCGDSEDLQSVEVNITRPTRPPFPPPSGLFKYVQSCENFCDDQFPPGFLGVVAANGVIACHKGCYSFELFKVMGKSKSFLMIEKICQANCYKDFGEETFDGKFCSMGCTKINMLYGNRVKELSKELTSRLHKLGQLESKNLGREILSDSLRKYADQAEKYMIERDLMTAEEIAVHVIVEHEKLHAVRYLTSGRPKSKIIHVERLWLSPEYQRYMKSERKKMFEEVEARIPELKAEYNIAEIYEAETREWEKSLDAKKRQTFPKHFDMECLVFQIPIIIYVLTVFLLVIVAIGLWATYGDPADCLFCLGRKFWDKLDNTDTYSVDLDEDDIVTTHDAIITKQMKDFNLVMTGDENYTQPPPDKDAPPPYVEINVYEPTNVEVRK